MSVNRLTANKQDMEILIDFFLTQRSTMFEEQPTRQTELFLVLKQWCLKTVATKSLPR